ncbi:MAG: DUF4176 domain-containing protein [Bacilli bacterium]|nr:DUF4176 domain-containing protein [Bacilli bacterium]
MKERFLPVGTVVTLKGADKKIMIIGYLPLRKDGALYDYSACTFPEGILEIDKILMFNHDQIDKINHIGLENKEYTDFNNGILNEYGLNKKNNG